MHGREVVEEDFLGEVVRVVAVDRLDAQQGEVSFVFLRRANRAGHRVAVAEAEAANLARRDVDVVRAGKVVVVGAAEEAETVGQDLQRPLAVHQPLELHPLLEDAEDQLLLLEAADVGDLFHLGGGDQLGHRHPLQLGDVDVAIDRIVAGDRSPDAADALGGFVELFGERQRFFAFKLGEQLAVDDRVAVAFGAVTAVHRARPVGGAVYHGFENQTSIVRSWKRRRAAGADGACGGGISKHWQRDAGDKRAHRGATLYSYYAHGGGTLKSANCAGRHCKMKISQTPPAGGMGAIADGHAGSRYGGPRRGAHRLIGNFG